MTQILATRAKALVGAVISGVAVYIATAVKADQPWTLHGLEGAAAGAVVTFLGVHQTANRRPAIHKRVKQLPKPSGRKGGMLPSPRDDRDYKTELATKVPSSVDNGAGITFGMLANDRIGDCYPAALLHTIQILTGYVPTDADALAVYEQAAGYNPDNPNSDNGTVGRQLYAWARKVGLIDSYAAAPVDAKGARAAIVANKVILCEWALPAGAESEGDVWTMPRSQKTAGSWGGHATCEPGFTTERTKNVTWGEYGTVTNPFSTAYLQAAWTVKVSKNAAQIAAVMAKVRAA